MSYFLGRAAHTVPVPTPDKDQGSCPWNSAGQNAFRACWVQRNFWRKWQLNWALRGKGFALEGRTNSESPVCLISSPNILRVFSY